MVDPTDLDAVARQLGREPRGVLPHDLAGVIRGPVVDRDELQLRRVVELPGEGLERGADVLAGVLGPHDHGHGRGCHRVMVQGRAYTLPTRG